MKKLYYDKLSNLDEDSVTLYSLYNHEANEKGSREIWLPDKVARKTLQWGANRLLQAKNRLKKYKIVLLLEKRDNFGQILKHYIYIIPPEGESSGNREYILYIIREKDYKTKDHKIRNHKTKDLRSYDLKIRNHKTKDLRSYSLITCSSKIYDIIANQNSPKENLENQSYQTLKQELSESSGLYLQNLQESCQSKGKGHIMKQESIFPDTLDTSVLEIIQHWNDTFSGIKGIRKHKKITSKVLKVKNKMTNEIYWKDLQSIIQESFSLGHSASDLCEAITNYSKILTGGDYFYDIRWTLAHFIYSGVHKKSGFVKFLTKNNPFSTFKSNSSGNGADPLKRVTKLFSPITEKYDAKSPFNIKTQRYYGFPIDRIKNYKLRQKYLEEYIGKNREINFTNFCELELVIAALIYFRKEAPNLKDLSKYMVIWDKNKGRFINDAKEKLKFS